MPSMLASGYSNPPKPIWRLALIVCCLEMDHHRRHYYAPCLNQLLFVHDIVTLTPLTYINLGIIFKVYISACAPCQYLPKEVSIICLPRPFDKTRPSWYFERVNAGIIVIIELLHMKQFTIRNVLPRCTDRSKHLFKVLNQQLLQN